MRSSRTLSAIFTMFYRNFVKYRQRYLFWFLLWAFITNAGACNYLMQTPCKPRVIATCEP